MKKEKQKRGCYERCPNCGLVIFASTEQALKARLKQHMLAEFFESWFLES